MIENEEQYYRECSVEELQESISIGRDGFQEGIYDLILAEARRRGMDEEMIAQAQTRGKLKLLPQEELLKLMVSGPRPIDEDARKLVLEEIQRRAISIPVNDIQETVVFTTSSIAEADVIKGLLESNGIEVFLEDNNLSANNLLYAKSNGDIDIIVGSNKSDMAKAIIQQYGTGRDSATEKSSLLEHRQGERLKTSPDDQLSMPYIRDDSGFPSLSFVSIVMAAIVLTVLLPICYRFFALENGSWRIQFLYQSLTHSVSQSVPQHLSGMHYVPEYEGLTNKDINSFDMLITEKATKTVHEPVGSDTFAKGSLFLGVKAATSPAEHNRYNYSFKITKLQTLDRVPKTKVKVNYTIVNNHSNEEKQYTIICIRDTFGKWKIFKE